MTYSPEKVVLWTCDKQDCGKLNRRLIPIGAKIFDDVCDYCGERIHEPLTDEIDLGENKNDRRQENGNEKDAGRGS